MSKYHFFGINVENRVPWVICEILKQFRSPIAEIQDQTSPEYYSEYNSFWRQFDTLVLTIDDA